MKETQPSDTRVQDWLREQLVEDEGPNDDTVNSALLLDLYNATLRLWKSSLETSLAFKTNGYRVKESFGRLCLAHESIRDFSNAGWRVDDGAFELTIFGLLISIARWLITATLQEKTVLVGSKAVKQLEKLIWLSERSLVDGDNDDDSAVSDDECEVNGGSVLVTSSTKSLNEIVNVLSTQASNLCQVIGSLDTLETVEIAKGPDEKLESKVHQAAAAYITLVLDKFNGVDAEIAKRLGEATWQRAERIRLNFTRQEPLLQHELQAELQIAGKSMFAPTTTFYDSGLGSSIKYAPTLVSTASQRAGISARVPPMPPEAERGRAFNCKICCEIVSDLQSRLDWKVHVFKDLQPYICCHNECSISLITFPTREMFLDHFKRKHSADYTARECPLCSKYVGDDLADLVKHISRHLESLALSCLPQELYPDEASGNEEESEDDGELKAVDPLTLSYVAVESNSHNPESKELFDTAPPKGDLFDIWEVFNAASREAISHVTDVTGTRVEKTKVIKNEQNDATHLRGEENEPRKLSPATQDWLEDRSDNYWLAIEERQKPEYDEHQETIVHDGKRQKENITPEQQHLYIEHEEAIRQWEAEEEERQLANEEAIRDWESEEAKMTMEELAYEAAIVCSEREAEDRIIEEQLAQVAHEEAFRQLEAEEEERQLANEEAIRDWEAEAPGRSPFYSRSVSPESDIVEMDPTEPQAGPPVPHSAT